MEDLGHTYTKNIYCLSEIQINQASLFICCLPVNLTTLAVILAHLPDMFWSPSLNWPPGSLVLETLKRWRAYGVILIQWDWVGPGSSGDSETL